MRRKLFPSIGIATTLITVAQPMVSADTIDINIKSKAEYNPKQPATWRQLDTPFSNQYYTPSRETGATFGMAGCGAFAIAALWQKSGYRDVTPLEVAQWLDTYGRDYSKAISSDEKHTGLMKSFVTNTPKAGITTYYPAYLGDYMDIDGPADKGVRYLSTGGDGVAFGYKINDNVHVWKKSLADKYPTLYQQDSDEYIRQEFAKGRFVMIVMTTRDGDHMAIVDDVLPDGTIVMVDSGGGYKYWEGMKQKWKATATSVFSYQAKGLDVQEAPVFWKGETYTKAKAAVQRNTQSNQALSEHVDLTNTKETDTVVRVGKPDTTMKNGKISTGETREVKFGASVVPFKTEYIMDKSLEPGVEKEVKAGVNGRVNKKHDYEIKAQNRVVKYGPVKVAVTVERRASLDLKPGQEKVVSNGSIGYKDHDGKIVEPMKPRVVEYGAKEVAYKVVRKETDGITSEKVIQKGKASRVDENGKVLVAPVEEIVAIPKASVKPTETTTTTESTTTTSTTTTTTTTTTTESTTTESTTTETTTTESTTAETTVEPTTTSETTTVATKVEQEVVYEADFDLEVGEQRVKSESPEKKVTAYGPERIYKDVIRRANNDLTPDTEKVIENGKDGYKNQNGEIVEDKTDMIIEIAPHTTPYSTDVRYTTDLAPGETMVAKQGVFGLTSYDGTVLSEPQDEIILRGVEKEADVPTVKVKDVVDTNRNEELEKDKQDALATPFEEPSRKTGEVKTLPATNVDGTAVVLLGAVASISAIGAAIGLNKKTKDGEK
jgi:polythreonine protein (fragment)